MNTKKLSKYHQTPKDINIESVDLIPFINI